MTMNNLKKLIDDVPVLGTPTHTGSISGLYQIYSKYTDDTVWGFTQSYKTREGVSHLLTHMNEDLVNKLDIKLIFTDGQNNTTTELFNTMGELNNEKNQKRT